MHRRTGLTLVTLIAGALAVLAVGSYATADSGKKNLKSGDLNGYEENPDLSTRAMGTFEISIDDDARTLTYELTYAGLEGNVLQSHIHLGARAIQGGISAFLCTNLGNGPPGTPTCPGPHDGTVEGTIEPNEVVGPTGQGIDPGEYGELLRAIRAGATYANVHSSKYPSGEIRAQLNDDDDNGHRDDD